MAMQGSSIAGVDVGGADIKLNEDGSYTLALGCTDMGTGCDTVMAQIAADCLNYTVWDNYSSIQRGLRIFLLMIPVPMLPLQPIPPV